MNPKVKDFMDISKYKHMPKPDQADNLPQPPLEMPCEGERIPLPSIESIELPPYSLKEAIAARQSVRSYSETPLEINELTYALWATQGIRKTFDTATLRTVPSAGARHAFETFLLINRVQGLASGLYRYLALEHALVKLPASDTIAEDLTAACLNQQMVKKAAVTFFWVADSYRMTYRYGERGYRYLFLDAGHVSQNLYLIASQIASGTCAIAAYDDDEVNRLLALDGEKYFTVYIAPLGKI